MKVFEIDGYWKDDLSGFHGHLVAEYDCTPDGYDDVEIFFYGLSENEICLAIKDNDATAHAFAITDYRVVDDGKEKCANEKGTN